MNPPGLGPHCVGQRVVVRRILHGETGPSGGPAFTDLLGVMESWTATETTVRAESGELTAIALADIATGKPVPPRPSPRLRISPEDAEHRANASWPARESVPLGQWLLRASDGFSSRANSALAVGDPGGPLADALSSVRSFYSSRGLPALVQVVTGSDVHAGVEAAGWQPARPGEADTVFMLASLARASRAARALHPPDAPPVRLGTTVTPAWLADDERARSHGTAALGVLEGPEQVVFGTVGDPVVARGRLALAGGDWAGISDVHVSPSHRRQGLAVTVLRELLAWAAERGATTAYLQVRGDNPGALALYDRLGFVAHHRYRYLAHTDIGM
jgi:N-acetylglutamate synthase